MNLLFMGPPGSGKGTQSKLLQKQYGLVHLSTGDMFRQAILDRTDVGLKAKGFMDRGEYVPDQVVIDLIRDRLKQPDMKAGFILDGFPRTEPQAHALDHALHELGMVLDKVISFEVKQAELVKRLSSRRTCRICQKIVSEDQLPSVQGVLCIKGVGAPCDFVQRDDDQASVVEKRILVYQTQTMPVLAYYRNQGALVSVDGSQPTADVFLKIVSHLPTKG